MASSGYIQQTHPFGYVRLSWSIIHQSIEDNISKVSYTLAIYSANSFKSTATKDYSISINGAVVSTGQNQLGGKGTRTLATGTVTIPHNTDGTKTFTLSFNQEIRITWSGVYIQNSAASGTGTLDKIPRPTTPTLSNTNLTMGTAATITMPRASDSFTHTLKILFGGTTRTIASRLGTSYTWTPPISVLAPDIPNATSGTGTLICETYEGSTLIGTRNVSVTMSVPSSVVPTISSISATETVAGIASKFGEFLQNVSKPSVAVSANGVYGSTIVAYKITLDGQTVNANNSIFEKLISNGSLTITATVTDSRGRTATGTSTITVLAYTAPVVHSFKVARCNSDGTENPEGINVKTTFAFDITPVNNLNDKYYEIVYRETGTSQWSTVASGNLYTFDGNVVSGAYFNVDKTYEIAMNLYDYVSSNSAQLEIPTAFTLIDLRSTGKGIAFGKVSQSDTMEVALDLDLTGEFLQETIQTPTLLNNWVNYGAGYAPAGYWKDKCGVVHLQGMIKSGATAAETVLFNLPIGYRPAASQKFFTVSVNDICIVDVYSSGNVVIKGCANAGWVSLSGITFRA